MPCAEVLYFHALWALCYNALMVIQRRVASKYMSRNIVLIGMPTSGKSTVGRRLAKAMDMDFVDTDLLLEKFENKPIQSIVNRRGLAYFRQLEERLLCELQLENHIISTGGSAVYSRAAMRHLSSDGLMIYLKISLPTLSARMSNISTRGLVKMPSYPLARLYKERYALYEDAADQIFDNNTPLTGLRFDALVKQTKAFEKNLRKTT